MLFPPTQILECIPVPRDIGDMAPIYFKKAIDECEGMWADNKKLVDLSKKNVRQAVSDVLIVFTFA